MPTGNIWRPYIRSRIVNDFKIAALRIEIGRNAANRNKNRQLIPRGMATFAPIPCFSATNSLSAWQTCSEDVLDWILPIILCFRYASSTINMATGKVIYKDYLCWSSGKSYSCRLCIMLNIVFSPLWHLPGHCHISTNLLGNQFTTGKRRYFIRLGFEQSPHIRHETNRTDYYTAIRFRGERLSIYKIGIQRVVGISMTHPFAVFFRHIDIFLMSAPLYIFWVSDPDNANLF